MSRGLGIWQRRIVEAMSQRDGGDFVVHRYNRGYWLRAGWHDMQRLSGQMVTRSCKKEDSDRAAFSRALRTLARRGLVEFATLVPLENSDVVDRSHHLADGLYMSTRQAFRFGRLRQTQVAAPECPDGL